MICRYIDEQHLKDKVDGKKKKKKKKNDDSLGELSIKELKNIFRCDPLQEEHLVKNVGQQTVDGGHIKEDIVGSVAKIRSSDEDRFESLSHDLKSSLLHSELGGYKKQIKKSISKICEGEYGVMTYTGQKRVRDDYEKKIDMARANRYHNNGPGGKVYPIEETFCDKLLIVAWQKLKIRGIIFGLEYFIEEVLSKTSLDKDVFTSNVNKLMHYYLNQPEQQNNKGDKASQFINEDIRQLLSPKEDLLHHRLGSIVGSSSTESEIFSHAYNDLICFIQQEYNEQCPGNDMKENKSAKDVFPKAQYELCVAKILATMFGTRKQLIV